MLIAVHGGRVLLEQRPAAGLWGGLWGFPSFDDEAAALAWCVERLCVPSPSLGREPVLQHAFTHFDLDIVPLVLDCAGPPGIADDACHRWYDPAEPARLGLAAPVATLIARCVAGRASGITARPGAG